MDLFLYSSQEWKELRRYTAEAEYVALFLGSSTDQDSTVRVEIAGALG